MMPASPQGRNVTKGARLVELIAQTDSRLSTAEQEQIVTIATQIDRIERSIGHLLQHYANRSRLSLVEAQTLAAVLDLGSNARLSSIAELVRVPLSTMTGVATRLERNGMVERKRASDDARAFVLSLTTEGRDRLRLMFGPFFEEISNVCQQVGPSTLETIVESFTTVSELAEMLESRLGIKPDS